MFETLRRYVNTLWDNTCILCHAVGMQGIDLCQACLEDLPQLGHSCLQCAIPLPQEYSEQYCGLCLNAPLDNYRVFAPFIYKPPVNHLIAKLKFKHDFSVSNVLGKLMGYYIKQTYTEKDLPKLLIPMPIHTFQLRRRGFNQAVELARPISRMLQINLDYASCIRVRDTSPQARLSEQAKLKNVKNAFKITKPIYYDHICLIDDFVTSGFTALSCSKTLFRNGVKRVDVWCLARAGSTV